MDDLADRVTRIAVNRPDAIRMWVLLPTTQGLMHAWNLDRRTWTGIPGEGLRTGAMSYDHEEHRLIQVRQWPKVGERSLIISGNPEGPSTVKQWRGRSRVERTEHLHHGSEVSRDG